MKVYQLHVKKFNRGKRSVRIIEFLGALLKSEKAITNFALATASSFINSFFRSPEESVHQKPDSLFAANKLY